MTQWIGDYEVTADRVFPDVLDACATTKRPRQPGTWITHDMRDAYITLHRLGHAHSIEAWKDGQLVGGLYGVSVGGVFCGESMFAKADDASKVAFVALVRQMRRWGLPLVDCQMHTPHLARFGASEIPRADYIAALNALRNQGRPPGPWKLDADIAAGRSQADDPPRSPAT